PNSFQKQYAKLMLSLNVDVVLGMHPHVIQPMSIEKRQDGGDTLLVYSLGNFVSGMQDGFNMLGGILSFDITKSAESGKTTFGNVLFTPIVTHYTLEKKVKADDTGHRNYKIYYLADYTSELAAKHGAVVWDKTHKPTLYGGAFSKENLIKTVKTVIPSRFLPPQF
ncbi:MAG: CapA family protein, partial [Clostridia bacterium]